MNKFTDYEGMRLRIMPTAFTRAQTRFHKDPVEVVYADVTVYGRPDLGRQHVAIFPRKVTAQIKETWVGKPIVGTLARRTVDPRPGYPPMYILDDLEVEA